MTGDWSAHWRVRPVNELTSQPVNQAHVHSLIRRNDLPKWLEVVAVIVLPLAYGLLVSAFFSWLHRRRSAGPAAAPAPPSGQASAGGGDADGEGAR